MHCWPLNWTQYPHVHCTYCLIYYLSGQANFLSHLTTLAENLFNTTAGNSGFASWQTPWSQEYPEGQQWKWLLPSMGQQEWSTGHWCSPPGQTLTLDRTTSFWNKTKWHTRYIKRIKQGCVEIGNFILRISKYISWVRVVNEWNNYSCTCDERRNF